LNNIYHQYYAVTTIKGGTNTIATTATIITTILPATAVSVYLVAAKFSGCVHTHMYNWMMQPQISGTSTSVLQGLGNNLVAYGYAMTGTTTCAVGTMVSTSLFLSASSTFNGGQYQTNVVVITPGAPVAPLGTATSYSMWAKISTSSYFSKVTSIAAAITPVIGIQTLFTQNGYWDFMQTNVVQGATYGGRGGGTSGTTPCGWYVGYFYEAPGAGIGASAAGAATGINSLMEDGSTTTVNLHFWTDNSVIKAASAFVIAGLAGLLF